MTSGLPGTFVISWSQAEVDGIAAASFDAIHVGSTWSWSGQALRVDGPKDVLCLGPALGAAELRRRAARAAQRRLEVACVREPVDDIDPLLSHGFSVTDGQKVWHVGLIQPETGGGRLAVFNGDVPAADVDFWVLSVRQPCAAQRSAQRSVGPRAQPRGVICFTPGTMLATAQGPRPVEGLRLGDRIQTKDNGLQPILWVGSRSVSGAALHAMPDLGPVRILPNALGDGVPDDGLLVSPDHRVVIKGAAARALFNQDEVLAAARDLVNDRTVFRERSQKSVTYIHLLLPAHEVVFANQVETESFHPMSAALSHLDEESLLALLDQLPNGRPGDYGPHARRCLARSEVAILMSDRGLGAI